jgi:gamma-glutamyltranspeptidase/glutathione hydrolase
MMDRTALVARFGALVVALALLGCASGSGGGEAPPRLRGEAMAAAANPYAVNAAVEILSAGGSAVDAAIAAELVLGLVEPQSSGVGGGGFLIHYDGRTEQISAYDGRERAPAGATPTMFLDARGRPMAFLDAQASGRSIGAPSLMHMLKLAHEDHGRLAWARLFEPAIRLALDGFAVSPRLATLIAAYGERGHLRADFGTRGYFFDREGNPLAAGAMLRNPQYAATLNALAAQGPRALTEGPIADAIIAAAQRNPRGGSLTHADLQAVQARRVAPVCAAYRVYRACTVGPPASGNAVLAIMGLYERARPRPGGVDNADDWSAFLWASRLAYADRDHYVGDDAFAPVPTQELIALAYLDERARLIDVTRAPTRVDPGAPAGPELYERWGRAASEDSGTTHLSIVDGWGDAVAMTATVESAFGAQRMAGGFLLNNQLTDFAFEPSINGRPVANAVEPRKAPRSSMSPMIVTDRDGELELVIGSPGGSAIIGYVARTTIGILDWNLGVQAAIDVGNATAREAPARIEAPRMPAGMVQALTARGWAVQESALEASGLHAIRVTPQGLEGGADPRREGVVVRVPAETPPAPAPAR